MILKEIFIFAVDTFVVVTLFQTMIQCVPLKSCAEKGFASFALFCFHGLRRKASDLIVTLLLFR